MDMALSGVSGHRADGIALNSRSQAPRPQGKDVKAKAHRGKRAKRSAPSRCLKEQMARQHKRMAA